MDLQEPLLSTNQVNKTSNKKKFWIVCAVLLSIAITITLGIALAFEKERRVITIKDQNKSEFFTLDNGIEVVIFHNNKTKNEAFASVSWPVGFLHDGDIQGISHLLEHIAFDQTVQRPGERNLFNYILSKGSDFNAWTSFQETNYYFSIRNDSLFEMLDILAEFLKTPTLVEVDVSRETKIIEEEWYWSAADAYWAESLVIYQNSNPLSSIGNLGTGNLQSFVTNLQAQNRTITQEINNFFHKFYSASKMKFAILSSYETESLKEKIGETFKDIPVRGKDKDFEIVEIPYRQQECQRIIFIESLEQKSELNIF